MMKRVRRILGGIAMGMILMSSQIGIAEEAHIATREDLAVSLVNQLGYGGIAKKEGIMVNQYSDVNRYQGEINLISRLGLMNGIGPQQFDPNGKVTAQTQSTVKQRLESQLTKDLGWKHAFYAIASNSQMPLMQGLDAVSFGWSELSYDTNTKSYQLDLAGGGDFKVPLGFEVPIDYAKQNGLETYLMVFFSDQNGIAKQFLQDKNQVNKVISQIVAACNGITKDDQTRAFDGVTLDFENFKDEALKIPYAEFFIQLERALDRCGKKLNIAVQPGRYFKGYDYATIGKYADRVIVMAHDYESKKLSPIDMATGNTYTPQTPIASIFDDLEQILAPMTGTKYRDKVVLQISFATAQWQTEGGKVLNQTPYTPGYDKVLQRLQMPGVTVIYDTVSQNPYATYTENGVQNTIWYENKQSVSAKQNLVRLLNLGGVSYWRLGTVPEDVVDHLK
ncbi:MAG: glycosyl hydrolase family 18 protein [Cellulosilyticaceae bacterium]